jgi:hypothetical protein
MNVDGEVSAALSLQTLGESKLTRGPHPADVVLARSNPSGKSFAIGTEPDITHHRKLHVGLWTTASMEFAVSVGRRTPLRRFRVLKRTMASTLAAPFLFAWPASISLLRFPPQRFPRLPPGSACCNAGRVPAWDESASRTLRADIANRCHGSRVTGRFPACQNAR